MELQEIRERINTIDDAIYALFDSRMQCSKEVAKIKLLMNDCIFKPQREKEVMARFSGEEQRLYRLYIRKMMQFSRFCQYREFLLAGYKDDAFGKVYGSIGNEAYSDNGLICVELETDPLSETALSAQEVLSLLGDFGVTLKSVQLKDTTVSFVVSVPEEAVERQHTELLFFMLYKECRKCEFSIADA